jgi:hypothetical protein
MFNALLTFSPLFSGLEASSLCAKVPVYNSQLFKPIYSKVAFQPTSRFPQRPGFQEEFGAAVGFDSWKDTTPLF